MKGQVEIQEETSFLFASLLITLLLILFTVALIFFPSLLKNTEAKADQLGVALKLDSTFVAGIEKGEIVREMKGIYDIEISKEKIKVKA